MVLEGGSFLYARYPCRVECRGHTLGVGVEGLQEGGKCVDEARGVEGRGRIGNEIYIYMCINVFIHIYIYICIYIYIYIYISI